MVMRRSTLAVLSGVILAVATPIVAWAAMLMTSARMGNELVNFIPIKVYTIHRGDTLWALAGKFGVSVSDLISWNDVTNPRFLQIGEKIVYHPNRFDTSQIRSAVYHKSLTQVNLASRDNSVSIHLPADVKMLYCTLTAYTAGYESTGKFPSSPNYDITSTGKHALQGLTVAVDPRVIPYGTKLYIPNIGFRIAEDTGGAIVGNHIDVFYNNVQVARKFGVKHDIPVYILPDWYPMPTF
jgi:3D (Asp-Asp-Asp) domain-containing protein